ncbi:MAG: 16S rRNA (uracil(1498)-N(3))-methyltransferase [Desulfobacca sp.]|nr:16S rRNA (uracil(1498)-N(3))-methyltransferase [Desulfobacca sp.]
MPMRRFFIAPEQVTDPNPYIMGDEARHLLKVLRMKVGDQVILFDNSGQEYPSRIHSVSGDRVFFEIGDQQIILRESPLQIFLGLPLIRSQPFEWILQKGTELGVTAFQPFFSAHSSRNFQKIELETRMNRWQKIVIEAAKQCRRNVLPELRPVVSFSDLLKLGPEALKIIPYEEESARTLKEFQEGSYSNRPVLALVGPEGGFSQEEVHLAEGEGFVPISLGPRTLRSETAALALICLCQFLWGDMGAGKKGGENALP